LAWFRLPWRRAPQDGRPRTARNFLIAATGLVLLLVLAAHGCSSQWTPESEMERYLKLGPRGGAAAIERDLLRDHPPGSDIGPLFARLARLGFDCGAAVEPGGGVCRFRAPSADRRVTTTLVELRHDGRQVEAIAVRMAVAPP
jgi:hypothetical protein